MQNNKKIEIFNRLCSKARLTNAWFGCEKDEFVVMTKNDDEFVARD